MCCCNYCCKINLRTYVYTYKYQKHTRPHLQIPFRQLFFSFKFIAGYECVVYNMYIINKDKKLLRTSINLDPCQTAIRGIPRNVRSMNSFA